jgi:hypothetical protein
MKSATKPTTKLWGQGGILRHKPARITRNSRSRLRALLLASVWMLPGIWCTGNAIAHELEDEHHEVHSKVSAGVRLAGLTSDHHHDHEHADLPAVVSKEGAKKLDSRAHLTRTCAFDSLRASTQILSLAQGVHTPCLTSASSGPRAPPIS